ncbi:hypothetical protein EDI_290960 [Entamoeba dispar SAW760]|uniref:Nucleoplasmin-like domain-containing protein n=1 Tax=Entamoeba dispar (strain ATCC PRA-260 / SAW760) TaxID=370354 RepID=B0ECP1_ENTDS|nr:uncharacterized protein EDI_290960 [Entamoeba dispar SAW760]EDR27703.1 hypothetical protein EDI_290960 [Entamoeba dispar SAW760]|eukprot:EDR27703.1 hypothetical protein EDI_290960 [Entamoeba dispar SAW760]
MNNYEQKSSFLIKIALSIKGGNVCEVKIKDKNVLCINTIALIPSKTGTNSITIRMTTSSGKSAFICNLNEQSNMYQTQTKLEFFEKEIVSFEAFGTGEVHLSGVLFFFDSKKEN